MAILICSCGGNKETEQADDKLGKMEIVIPDELKDNPEMVEYIEDMTELVDDYAVVMDEMVDKLKPFAGKTFDELKIGQQLKFTAIVTEVGVKSAPYMTKWAEYEMKWSNLEEGLTEDQLLALETVGKRFEERMEQIAEKYAEYYEE